MGLLTRSSRRQLSTTLIHRATRKIAGKLLEPLEGRLLYTAAPTLNISGPGVVSEGSTYTLALSATGSNVNLIDHWTINWGDSQTTTFSGNPSTASHVYADGPSTATITGTATLTDNTVVTANLGGAATDNGTLDPSFNGTGKVTVNPGGTGSIGKAIAVQSDGKIVEAGPIDGIAQIIRLNPDGSLDTTFAGTGKIVSDFGFGFTASAVGMQTVAGVEKIIVAGQSATTFHSAVIRLNLDGTLDPTFGSGGIKQFSIAGTNFNLDGIRAMAILPDGRILTAGTALNRFNSATADVALAQFNVNGSPDLTFNGTGQLTTDLGGGNDTALQVKLNSDGSFDVLAQGPRNGSQSQLIRYTAAGALDPTFGVGGIATIPATNQFFAEGFAVDATGNIYVSGNTFGSKPSGSENAAIARLTPTGALDTTFQTGGFESFFLDGSNDDASNIALQSDGKIILAGVTTNFFIGAGPGANFFVMRLSASGVQDNTFGSPTPDRFGNVGVVRLDFLGGNDTPSALAFSNDGRLIVAGSAQNPSGSTSVVAIAQFGAAGTAASPVSVIINNANPSVSITGLPTSSNEGTALTLGANVSDPSPVDTAAGFTYSWVVSKDSSFYASAATPTFTLNPDDNGLYQVTLFVHDKDGGAASDTEDITINNVAPTVTTLGAPASSPEATTITASATATDPSSVDTTAGFTFAWSVTKDGAAFASGPGASASFTPDDNGIYSLTITATDKDNGVGSSVSTITVTNVAPVASFTSAPTTGTEGSEISFTGSATDVSPVDTAAGLTYSWTVSKDGNAFAAGTGATIDFTPDDNGTYLVTLTATDKDNGAGSAMATIDVANTAPVVTLPNAPTAGNEGDTISYSGASITDASAVDTAAGFTTTWTVTKNSQPFASGTGTNVTFTPDDNGDYQLTLSATDKDNATTSATADITIANVAPTVTVTAPASSDEGSPVTASAGATDPSTADTTAGFTFSWAVTKDASPFAAGTGDSATFTPDDNGLYSVTFTATDKDGGSSNSSADITVNNVAPTVALTSPTTGAEGSAISASSSATDPSTADTTAGFTYTWSVTKDGGAFADGTGTSINFTPDDNGVYMLTVSATDKDGGVGTASTEIDIANVAPTFGAVTAPSSVAEGSTVTASATATDPSSVDTTAGLTYSWSVTKDGSAFAAGAGSSAVFTPDDNATYQLTFTATDKDGGTASTDATILATNVAPSYAGSGAASFSPEGTTITSTATASDPSSVDTTDGLTYSWSVTKDNAPFASGSGATAIFTPDDNGLYVLTQSATDKDGATGTTNSTIHVTNVAPTVTLANAPTTGNEGSAVSYSGASATDPSTADTTAGFTYSWSVTKNNVAFASGAGVTAAFTPDDNGLYALTVTATDKDGDSGSASANITVANVAPTVSLSNVPTTGNEGTAISFTAGSSVSDPSSVDTAAGFLTVWSVTKNNSPFASGSGTNVSFTPDDNGVYKLTLTATDKDGGSGSASSVINVSNVAPTVSLSNVPATGNEGSAISFAISSSVTDPSTADTAAGFTTAWTVKKNGSPYASGSGTSVSFTPNDNGTYTLTLTATDKDGGSGSASSTINVLNVAPTVSLTNVPTTGNEGTAISFTAGSSVSDPSSVDTAAGFTISWSATKNGSPFASGSGTSINFTPDDNGTYVLTLSATDKDGGVGSASRTINVANVAPTITSDTIIPSTAVRNQTINYSAAFTDPGTHDNPTATWNFGDGNTASGSTASHVYTATGTYTVTLTVTDKDGGTTTQTKQVTILAVAVETDPADPTKTALYIGGTNANDTITVNPGGGSGSGAQVILNGVNLGVFNLTGHIVVFGGAGDDNIQIAGGLNYPTELFGQAGNDKIKGDNAPNIIVGGDGNDILVGGNNRDLLIGGNGADQITGGSGDDILVASATSYDANSTALESIMKEWTRTDACFADRVIHLLYGGGLNGSTTINTDTVFADSNADTLTGSSGDDVFVFNTNDDITDFNATQDAGAIDLSWIIVPF